LSCCSKRRNVGAPAPAHPSNPACKPRARTSISIRAVPPRRRHGACQLGRRRVLAMRGRTASGAIARSASGFLSFFDQGGAVKTRRAPALGSHCAGAANRAPPGREAATAPGAPRTRNATKPSCAFTAEKKTGEVDIQAFTHPAGAGTCHSRRIEDRRLASRVKSKAPAPSRGAGRNHLEIRDGGRTTAGC